MSDHREPTQPVFVGGTGRSGTTIGGLLLDSFPGIRLTLPPEVRFISGTNGVLDVYETLVDGQTHDGRTAAPEKLRRNLHGPWFKRAKPSGFVGGLHLSIDKPAMREATARYLDEIRDDPGGASRRLTETIINGQRQSGAPIRWVDSTPKNARRADALRAVFPDARVVHMTRDGRDVAMSFAAQSFGPADAPAALEAWFDRMSLALTAESLAPPGTVLRMPLMDLARHDRIPSLHRLGDFLGLDATADVIDWFNTEIDAERAHEGRWRRDAEPLLAAQLDERYQQMLAELTDRWGDPFRGPATPADDVPRGPNPPLERTGHR